MPMAHLLNNAIKNTLNLHQILPLKMVCSCYVLSNSGENLFEKHITFFNNRANGADGGAIQFSRTIIKNNFQIISHFFKQSSGANGGWSYKH